MSNAGNEDSTHTMAGPVEIPSRDEFPLLDHWRAVRKHCWMIAALVILAVLAAVIATLLSPREYLGVASVVPPIDILRKESGPSARLGGGAQSMLRDIMDVGSVADMYVGILKSRVVADAIVDRFQLLEVYENVETRSDARQELERKVRVKAGKEGIVQITVKDRDPVRAAAMANALVEELDRQNKRLSGSQATSKRQFLENRLAEITSELRKIDTLPTWEAQIKEMLFEMFARESELAKIEETKSMPTIQVLDHALVPERPVGRGGTKRVIVAGFLSFFLGLLLAFAQVNVSRPCHARG